MISLIAVVSLALGIGANTAIFSLVNAVLLRPLAVAEPDRLARIFVNDRQNPGPRSVSYLNYRDIRDQNDVFTGVAAYRAIPIGLTEGDETERIWGALVSANYFSVLGVKPALGRTFLSEEDQSPGAAPVVILGHGLWQRKFASDPHAIGRTILVNGHRFSVVGVAPKSFSSTEVGVSYDMYVPLMMYRQAIPGITWFDDRRFLWLGVIGRLKSDVTFEQAQASLASLASQLEMAYPDVNKGRGASLVPLNHVRVGLDTGKVYLISALLMSVVGIVLMISCANVANLLLARAAARQKEIAVRLAIGADRGRLIRQLLTESTLLSVLGAAVGLLLTGWTARLLLALQPPTPIPRTFDASPDLRVLTFTVLLAVVSGVLFGLAPALQSSKPDLVGVLKNQPGSPSRARGLDLRSVLVAAQVALSLMLLIGAGLFIRSMDKAQRIDLGFKSDRVLVLSLDLGLAGYTESQGRVLYQQLLDRIQTLPGVRSVSVAAFLPLSDNWLRRTVIIEGREPPPSADRVLVDVNMVEPKYFETMGIPLLQGRDFRLEDDQRARPVAIINEAMARAFWPGEIPISRRFRFIQQPTVFEVIGVARNSTYHSVGESSLPYIYLPFRQHYTSPLVVHASTSGDPAALQAAVRREVQALDSRIPVFDGKTLSDQASLALWPARMGAGLLGFFGLLAIVLAAVGLYGVLSYSVSQRAREIGIRMALGARRGDVLTLVLRRSMSLVAVGLILGFGATVAVTRLLSSLLYDVSPTDPATFAATSVALAAVAFVASYIPARRATQIDPLLVLK